MSFESSLYNIEKSTFSGVLFANFVSQPVTCLFILLSGPFTELAYAFSSPGLHWLSHLYVSLGNLNT